MDLEVRDVRPPAILPPNELPLPVPDRRYPDRNRNPAKPRSALFALVAKVKRYDLLRALLSIAAVEDLELLQMDVTTAFLPGDLEEELYLQQPDGFPVAGRESDVYRLQKSLYGLKQASRTWSPVDPFIYYLRDGCDITIVAIWVDDGLLSSNKKKLLSDIVQYLQIHFQITSGPADVFVGLLINRDRPNRSLHISQPHYIRF